MSSCHRFYTFLFALLGICWGATPSWAFNWGNPSGSYASLVHEVATVEETLVSKWLSTIPSLSEPQPALNCQVLELIDPAIRSIVQVPTNVDAATETALRRLAEGFMENVILGSSGQMNLWYQEGTLYGVEFDWFFVPSMQPPVGEILPTIGEIVGYQDSPTAGADPTPILLASVYCYNEEQFNLRQAAIEAMLQHPMNLFTQDWCLSTTDTQIRRLLSFVNFGSESSLALRGFGDSRSLVGFDLADAFEEFAGRSLVSARLQLEIVSNTGFWSSSGVAVNVHRMNVPWSESAATWGSPADLDLSNWEVDGAEWQMGHSGVRPFEEVPSDSCPHYESSSGRMEWDVTADVQDMIVNEGDTHSWMLRLANENMWVHLRYGAKEGDAARPRLVLEWQ